MRSLQRTSIHPDGILSGNLTYTMERSTILDGKLTIPMAMFNGYIKLPKG